jgi:serine/threonine protein kinase
MELDKNEILGSGGYGVVFAGTYDGNPVAIKRIQFTDDLTELLREEDALKKLNHPNVVKLYSITSNDDFK